MSSCQQLFAVTCGFHGNWAQEELSVMYLLHRGNRLPSCRSVLRANVCSEAEAHLINISRYKNARPPGQENSLSIKILLRDGLPWQKKKKSLLPPALSVPLLLSKLPEKPGWVAELHSCHEPGTACLGFYRFIPLAASHVFPKYRTRQRRAVRSSPGSVRTTDSSQIDHGLQM